jgi:hypothetical protein
MISLTYNIRCQQNRSQPRIQPWPLETLSILVGVLQLDLFMLKPYTILWTTLKLIDINIKSY